ncbi:MAG: FtsX-like permease family protein [Limnothrix sp. RL_2_0]|nr:FtsX-like permease family protein [Limnothrix sp. RL_2_0]
MVGINGGDQWRLKKLNRLKDLNIFAKRRWTGPPLPWRNLRQAPGQFALAIAAISFAVMLIFMQLGILGAVLQGATLIYDQLDFDIVLISQKSLEVSFTQPFSRQQLYRVNGLADVASTASVYLSFSDFKNPEDQSLNSILVMAIPLEKSTFKSQEINQKRNILQQQDTVLFNRLSDDNFGTVTTGIVSELQGKRVKVGGLFTMNNSFRFIGSVLMSEQNFNRFYPRRSPDEISLGLVKIKPDVDIDQVITQIRQLVPQSITVLSRAEAAAKDQYYWLTSTSIGIIVSFGVSTAFLIGAVIVYQILNADVMERLPEYGTLKATGYSNQQLAKIVIQQSTIIGLLGYIVGLFGSLALYQIMRSATALPIQISILRILLVLFLTLIMCNLSALVSLQKVIKLDPSDIFN